MLHGPAFIFCRAKLGFHTPAPISFFLRQADTRQIPAEYSRANPDCNDQKNARQRRRRIIAKQTQNSPICHTAHERRHAVNVLLKHKRHFLRADIANNTAADPRCHAKEDAQERVPAIALRNGDLRAGNGKCGKSDGIKHIIDAFQRRFKACIVRAR